MTKAQRNVLEAMVEMTTKTRGKNRGDVKSTNDGSCYHASVLSALGQLGYLDYKVETIYGTGWFATKSGVAAVANQS